MKGRETGIYVYGIVGQGREIATLRGVDERSAVSLFPFREIAAVMSEVSLEEFGERPIKERLKDAEWTKEKILAHEQVLEEIMIRRTVVPMKFATIFKSEEGLSEMLESFYPSLQELLAQLEAKEEWGVKVFADLGWLREATARSNDEIRSFLGQTEKRPKGVAYLMKKKMEAAIEEELDKEIASLAQGFFDRLSKKAVQGKMNPLASKELTGKAKEMILNSVFLVRKDEKNEFFEVVEALQKEQGKERIDFEAVGPFPPYNFVSLEGQEVMKK